MMGKCWTCSKSADKQTVLSKCWVGCPLGISVETRGLLECFICHFSPSISHIMSLCEEHSSSKNDTKKTKQKKPPNPTESNLVWLDSEFFPSQQ